MPKKKTIASLRIKQELKHHKLSGRELARISGISYYDMDNILSGKSSKVDKLILIAQTLNKPVLYFLDKNYKLDAKLNLDLGIDLNSIPDPEIYNTELHSEAIRMIHESSTQHDLNLSKNQTDQIFSLICLKLEQTKDKGNLALKMAKAVIDHVFEDKPIGLQEINNHPISESPKDKKIKRAVASRVKTRQKATHKEQ